MKDADQLPDQYPDTPTQVFASGAAHGKRKAAHHYRKSIAALYKVLGFDEGVCRSCERKIWWAVTPAGKKIPLTIDGVAHFTDCPNAGLHRRAKK